MYTVVAGKSELNVVLLDKLIQISFFLKQHIILTFYKNNEGFYA